MSQFERINKINSVLQNSKNAVEIEKFLSVLEISKATFKRDLAYMRDRLNAPIIWDKDGRGYRYSTGSGKYELPGLWFNSSEILALLVMEHLLENLQPGLLTPHIDPMRTSVRALIEKGEHSADEVIDRIRLISLASRDYDIGCFETVSIGLLNRKRLKINYYNRERDEYLGREVSPQRLVHYRENWYLDSWCHLRNDLRTFALEMINTAELLSKTAKNISKKRLDNHFTGSYGIFSGTSDNLAVLKFNPIRARWVKNDSGLITSTSGPNFMISIISSL